MATFSGPVRLTSKNGEDSVIVTDAFAFNNLHFGQGYRVDKNQDGVEPDPNAPRLDNGVLVQPAVGDTGAVVESEGLVVADEPDLVPPAVPETADEKIAAAPSKRGASKPVGKVESGTVVE